MVQLRALFYERFDENSTEWELLNTFVVEMKLLVQSYPKYKKIFQPAARLLGKLVFLEYYKILLINCNVSMNEESMLKNSLSTFDFVKKKFDTLGLPSNAKPEVSPGLPYVKYDGDKLLSKFEMMQHHIFAIHLSELDMKLLMRIAHNVDLYYEERFHINSHYFHILMLE